MIFTQQRLDVRLDPPTAARPDWGEQLMPSEPPSGKARGKGKAKHGRGTERGFWEV